MASTIEHGGLSANTTRKTGSQPSGGIFWTVAYVFVVKMKSYAQGVTF
jgi:hypothetical protein